MAKISIKCSIPTFHELAQKLEESGVKITDTDSFTITKDTVLERPIDWRLLTVRKDCVTEAAKVYRHRQDTNEMEITDSSHFLNYVEDIYNYILNGDKPEVAVEDKPETPKKQGW